MGPGSFRAFASLVIALGLGAGCETPGAREVDESEVERTTQIDKAAQLDRPVPLEPAFVLRALRALDRRLPKDAPLLELRATGSRFDVQVIHDDGVSSFSYEETRARGSGLAPAEGSVAGPVQVPVYGGGSLGDNGFSREEVDVGKVLSAFPVAVKAIDPADGRVDGLVVRRYLPFGTAVRARIYVDSPRMSGSIDTNGHGVPLKN